MKKLVPLFLLMVVLAGCAMMTDQQIKEISDAVGNAAATGASIAAPALGVDGGAVAGIAGAVGFGVAYLVKLLLTLFQKKSE